MNVIQPGGPGVAIDRLLNWPIKNEKFLLAAIFLTPLKIETIPKLQESSGLWAKLGAAVGHYINAYLS